MSVKSIFITLIVSTELWASGTYLPPPGLNLRPPLIKSTKKKKSSKCDPSAKATRTNSSSQNSPKKKNSECSN